MVAAGISKGQSAFKFENMWLKDEGFVERVRQWWNGCCFLGSPSFILAWKLKALKDDLKKWNKEEFGDLAFWKKSLLSELLGLDAREDLLGLSHEEQTRRTQINIKSIVLPMVEVWKLNVVKSSKVYESLAKKSSKV